jgi:hypothetical protein
MTLRKAILVIIIWVIFLIAGSRILHYFNENDNGCALAEYVYDQEIDVVVKKKFINSSQHNYETIIYRGDDGGDDHMVFSGPEYGALFDFLNVGDRIIKKKNSFFYQVQPNATDKDTVFQFETSCQESFSKTK